MCALLRDRWGPPLKLASGSLADIHPGPPFARKKECVRKIYLIHIHISSSLTLENISGLECVHGVLSFVNNLIGKNIRNRTGSADLLIQ